MSQKCRLEFVFQVYLDLMVFHEEIEEGEVSSF